MIGLILHCVHCKATQQFVGKTANDVRLAVCLSEWDDLPDPRPSPIGNAPAECPDCICKLRSDPAPCEVVVGWVPGSKDTIRQWPSRLHTPRVSPLTPQ